MRRLRTIQKEFGKVATAIVRAAYNSVGGMSWLYFDTLKKRQFINLLIIIALVSLFTFLITFRALYKAFSLTLEPPVPSGDDSSENIVFGLMLVKNNWNLISDNHANIWFQYPNIIHILIASFYFFTRDVTYSISFLKIYSFSIYLLGLVLYSYLVYFVMKSTVFIKRSSSIIAIFLFCSLTSLASRGPLWTLNDGSIMELTVILVLTPLAILTLQRKKYFMSGIFLGLSAINYLGLFEMLVVVIPWLLAIAVKKNVSATLKIMAGVAVGGNLFLLRLERTVLVPLIEEFTYSGSLSPSVGSANLSKIIYLIENIYGNISIFVIYLFINIVSLSLAIADEIILIRNKDSSSQKICNANPTSVTFLSLIWMMHLLLTVVSSQLSVSIIDFESLTPRLVRTNLFLSSVSITASLFTLYSELGRLGKLVPNIGIRFKTTSNKDLHFRLPSTKILKNDSLVIYFLMVVVIYSIVASPILYLSLYDYTPNIRANEEEIHAYLNIKNEIMEKGEANFTILGISQVSGWLPTFLTIPERNITVFLISTPEIYLRHGPRDPKRIIGLELYQGIEKLNISIFKKYNVRYVVVELPKKGLWYEESIRQFAQKLWFEEFNGVGRLVYEENDEVNAMKVWKIQY